LTMRRIAGGFPLTRPMARRIACPISRGHYQGPLVSGIIELAGPSIAAGQRRQCAPPAPAGAADMDPTDQCW